MLPTIVLFFALFITIFLSLKILLKTLIFLETEKIDINLEGYLFIIPCLLWSFLFYLLNYIHH